MLNLTSTDPNWLPLNPNFPPKIIAVNEPFGDQSLISSEDYLILINKLNEFADNTFTFGESILKRMEESGLNEKMKMTMNKGAEIGNNLMKKTRE